MNPTRSAIAPRAGYADRYTTIQKGTTMLISESKVYELALSSIKEEHVNDFQKQYIPAIFPILTEYGGRFLINGTIQNSIARKFPAKSFALLEWPSIDQYVKINKDERVSPLIETRNQYLAFIIEGCFYKVLEDTDFEIPEHRSMTLLLSDRSILEDRSIRFRWISDSRNSELSLNLYFSDSSTKLYEIGKDIDEFSIELG
jgi:uncharacterized protein (DUF1330 family)